MDLEASQPEIETRDPVWRTLVDPYLLRQSSPVSGLADQMWLRCGVRPLDIGILQRLCWFARACVCWNVPSATQTDRSVFGLIYLKAAPVLLTSSLMLPGSK